jgi:hypothetical protein
MMKKIFTTAFMLTAFASFCFAQDITGKWAGKVMDQFDVTYDFKVDGEKLTGTSSGPDGTPIPLRDGVIKGDTLSFNITIMDNDLKATGKIKDDAITITMPGMNGGDPITFVLKKVK